MIDAAPAPLPPHRIALHGEWSLWRCVCLRSTGFPVDWLERISDQDLEVRWQELRSAEDDRTELGSRTKMRSALEAAHAAALANAQAALCEIAADEQFRLAVSWQNHRAVTTALDHLCKPTRPVPPWRRRQDQSLVANYLQRYCVKNETIGFFGPVGWAEFVSDDRQFAVRPGPQLIAARKVHFEPWSLTALLEKFHQDPSFRANLRPRLSPACTLEPGVLYLPDGRSRPLDRARAAFLAACDGTRTAAELTTQFGGDEAAGFTNRGAVWDVLEQLQTAQILIWAAVLPSGNTPENALALLLSEFPDHAVAARCRTVLDSFLTHRATITAATTSAELVAAMTAFDAEFERATTRSPHQLAGQNYAGRTLIYEDCRRDVEITLSRDLLRELGPPLGLVLNSARWFTRQLAAQFLDFASGCYRDLATQANSPRVPLQLLWRRILTDQPVTLAIVDDVLDQLQKRWVDVLRVTGDIAEVQYSSHDLNPAVSVAFAADGAGWPGARLQSPDIILAANSPAAVAAGQYFFVFGEIHTSCNTTAQALFVNLHPHPDTVMAWCEIDQGEPELLPVIDRHQPGQRVAYDLRTRHDYHLLSHDSVSWRAPSQVLRIGDLIAFEEAGDLQLGTRNGQQQFPAMAFFGPQLRGLTSNRFRLLPAWAHVPRVTIDRLVIQRETWRFNAADLDFLNAKSAFDRFEAIRRFGDKHQLPRRVFVKVPGEVKPVYIDFASPILVELLFKLARKCPLDRPLQISEMLPLPEDSWLRDAAGAAYTSELRLVAVDAQPAATSAALIQSIRAA